MTAALVSPHAYTDPEHYEKELTGLFSRCWLFAGLMLELQEGHMGVRLGNTDVLLQIDKDGKPRAFLNVCSHRHAQLCPTGLTRGPVRCPYHGWSYDRRGVPAGIPQKQCFPDVVENPEKYRLQEFECEAVGQFIFVRLTEGGPDLRRYLGSQYAFLERASIGMDGVMDEFRKDVDANWKVVIENGLEGYHVFAVHQKTFVQVNGMSREEAAPQFFLDDPRHTHLEHATNAEWVAGFKRREAKVGRWPWRFEHYTHHLIFPNLTITSFMGYSFHIQRFDPVAPQRTQVHSRTVGVRFEDSTEVGRKMMERIYLDGHEFTRRVFDEDGEICAKVQNGLRNARQRAVLGNGIEDRVAHFQRAYVEAVGE